MRLSPRFQPVPAHLLHVGGTITTVWGMKILMIERERESRVEWVLADAATTVVLQWEQYFPHKPLPYFLSEPMWLNHHTGWLSAQTAARQSDSRRRGAWRELAGFSYKCLELKVRLCVPDCVPQVVSTSGARSMTHRDSSGKQRRGTCSWRQMPKIPPSCSLDKGSTKSRLDQTGFKPSPWCMNHSVFPP